MRYYQEYEKIPGTKGPGFFRRPDFLDHSFLGEIKNVFYLARTSQINDYLRYALQHQKIMVILVRAGCPGTIYGTKLSPQLQQLVDDGWIIISRVL